MVSEVVPYAGTPAHARGLVISCKHACMLWGVGLVPAEVVELASVSQLLSSALGELYRDIPQFEVCSNVELFQVLLTWTAGMVLWLLSSTLCSYPCMCRSGGEKVGFGFIVCVYFISS